MNNKEAIEFLKNMIDQKAVTLTDNDFTARYHIEALQMAIESLNEQYYHKKLKERGYVMTWVRSDKNEKS